MYTQLAIYCIVIALVSWLGGYLPNIVKLGHRRTQMVLSLVSGVMLGVALLHLLPHAILILGEIQIAMGMALGGLLFMFFMIRMFHFHQHDLPEGHDHDCDHAGHDHEHLAKGNPVDEHHLEIQHGHGDVSWLGIAFGFSIHTIIDGVALAAAVQSEGENASWLAGLGVFLAIVLHKPLDALTITSVMAARGWSAAKRNRVNALFSIMCPLGAGIFVLGVQSMSEGQDFVLGLALAFAAGVFLCISLGDLLPEVQFHRHDRMALSGMLVLGVAIALAIEMLPGHDHTMKPGEQKEAVEDSE